MKNYGGKWIWLGVLLLTALLGACSRAPLPDEAIMSQANSWKALGGALDTITKNNAVNPKLLLDRNGKLVAVWAEDNGLWYLQAKRWNGTAWETLSLPSKALPYTNLGVNAFDAVFDSTNALVVSQLVNPENGYSRADRVEVYGAGSSSWTKLATFKGLVQLQTNSSGQVHAVFQNKTLGNNAVRRWTGSGWQNVATLKEKAYEETPGFPPTYVFADSFILETDGKPVLEYGNYTGYGSLFRIWTGTGWKKDSRGRHMLAYTLNSSNQIVAATSFYTTGTDIDVDGTTIGQGVDGVGLFLTFQNNKVVLLNNLGNKPTVTRWTGSAWQQLGGRIGAKVSFASNLVVDKQRNLFVVWTDAACANSASCGGANIYVSQYVP